MTTEREQFAGVGDNGELRVLLGRRAEVAALKGLLGDIVAGDSRSLVLRGEAGIGKTALLQNLIDQAKSCTVIRTWGMETEHELAFAALHQLCLTMLDYLPRLPAPQRQALEVTFGLEPGPPPDQFMVGLAVLGLFGEVARERPLLAVVDDAQWLDKASARTLGFVARRLRVENVGIVFGVRAEADDDDVAEFAGLSEMTVGGLADKDARTLLSMARLGPVDEQVLQRLIAESHGNPLALLELPRDVASSELDGGFGLMSTAALPRRIEESFRRQVGMLGDAARQLLLVAASEPTGDPVLVWRAAAKLGDAISTDAGESVSVAPFLQLSPRVRFRHPLLRSAVYRTADPDMRRRVHRALADVTDPVTDPDRRSWHRAQSVREYDDDIALELDESAERARARGGFAAAAAFSQRAAELSSNGSMRAGRLLNAAEAEHLAAMPEAVGSTLTRTDAGALDAFQRARANLLWARLAFTTDRSREAPLMLANAAAELAPYDRSLACETHLEALQAGWFAAQLMMGTTLKDLINATARTARPGDLDPATELLIEGLARRFNEGYEAGAQLLLDATNSIHEQPPPFDPAFRRLWFACVMSLDLFQDELADQLSARLVEQSQRSGLLATTLLTLNFRAAVRVIVGDLEGASEILDQMATARRGLLGVLEPAYVQQFLAAWRGRRNEGVDLAQDIAEDSTVRGEGLGLVASDGLHALLCNGLGLYDEALTAARRAVESNQEIGNFTWGALMELTIAASHTGETKVGADALERLTQMAEPCGTPWALGLLERSRAMLAPAADAEAHHREAIRHLSNTRVRGELARAELYFGEWLAEQGREDEAREHLRAAHAGFSAMGAEGYEGLAADALALAGEQVRKRPTRNPSPLTKQEAQIVRLVRSGMSNNEIATRLFISPRTVEWHLGRVFTKLGISSRRQLRQ